VGKAIRDYTEAIRLDPTSSSAFVNRAAAWLGKKQWDKAISDCTEAIRLDPKDTDAFHNRALARKEKEDFNEAIKDFDAAIKLNPKACADSFRGRGFCWSKKGEYGKAVSDCDEAIRLDPTFPGAFYNRGVARAAQKEYDTAIVDFTEAIRLDPKYVHPLAARAFIRAGCPIAKFRDGVKAVEDATKACELSEWKNPNHLEILAAAYAETGEFDYKWQKKALDDSAYEKQSGEKGRRLLKQYERKEPYREDKN